MMRRWLRGSSARAKAYTLTEMLVVLMIIGLLAAIIGPRLFSRLDDAKVRTARLQMSSLQTGVDLFRLDVGRLPTTEEGLQALVVSPAGEEGNWLGPYLARSQLPLDPWGNAYTYEAGAEGYQILSFGADGREGGAGVGADILTDLAPEPAVSNGAANPLR